MHIYKISGNRIRNEEDKRKRKHVNTFSSTQKPGVNTSTKTKKKRKKKKGSKQLTKENKSFLESIGLVLKK